MRGYIQCPIHEEGKTRQITSLADTITICPESNCPYEKGVNFGQGVREDSKQKRFVLDDGFVGNLECTRDGLIKWNKYLLQKFTKKFDVMNNPSPLYKIIKSTLNLIL
ncbi:MAG: hypothetical protein ABIA78_01600 [archaeon]